MKLSDILQNPRQWLVDLAKKHGLQESDVVEFTLKPNYWVLKHECPEGHANQPVPSAYRAVAEKAQQHLIAAGWIIEQRRSDNHVLYAKDNVRVGVLTVTIPASHQKFIGVVAYGVYTYTIENN